MDKFFELEPVNHHIPEYNDNYECYAVKGLRHLYYEKPDSPLHEPVGGAIALLRHRDYPGYCQVFYGYTKYEDDKVHVDFTTAYTKEGDRVFVKFSHDQIYCTFICGVDADDPRACHYKCQEGMISIMKDYGIEL